MPDSISGRRVEKGKEVSCRRACKRIVVRHVGYCENTHYLTENLIFCGMAGGRDALHGDRWHQSATELLAIAGR